MSRRAAVAEGTDDLPATEPNTNGAESPVVFLSREAIMGAMDLQQEVVAVPEWGGSVIVRGLTGLDRDSFERAMLDVRGNDAKVNWRNFRAKLICRSVVDAAGKRIFRDEDADMLGAKSAVALQRIFRVAQRLSGLADDEVEELTTALKDAPSEGSGSD